MINLDGITHHPAIEEPVDVLCNKTQNTDRGFFRVEMAHFLAKMASCMRATIVTKDRGDIPVSTYALLLATSGFGKGHSVNVVEGELMKPFKLRFMTDTMPVIAEKNLWDIANERAVRNGTDQQEEFDKLGTEYKKAGAYAFTFDDATSPAVKQLRHKLLLANCGSINLQIDEIGSNLEGRMEALNLFLELYDQGLVKQKLTKNTNDSQRAEEVDGKTPTNMLLFGTPTKMFDGGKTEDLFYALLETGYARRCLFGIGQQDRKAFNSQSPAEIYKRLIQPTNSAIITKWAAKFHRLADPGMFGWKITVDDAVGIQLMAYKIACERVADGMAEHEEIKKAELSHRYFKALKLAGALAFVDESPELEMGHLMQAILLVEESGAAFQKILSREKTYVKLAKYIAAIGSEVTHADLNHALPYYKQGAAARNEMMNLAMGWGYKRHIVIKKSFIGGIEFFQGETLKETDLTRMRFSYSDHWAYNYVTEEAPFEDLHVLTQAPGPMQWANHVFKNGHRCDENTIVGFNMIVIDVDGDIPLNTAHELMKEYKFLTYTTKRHTETENRFRLILPINYYLELDSAEYKEFMNGIMAWMPFKSDEAANQRSKTWKSFDGGSYHYNMEGQLFDVLPFIPKTSLNEAHQKSQKAIGSLDNLERWFAQRMVDGSRNNHMIKFALALIDSGLDLPEVMARVRAFDQKLPEPLGEDELSRSIFVTAAKRFQRQDA